jgi:hypothetical protein
MPAQFMMLTALAALSCACSASTSVPSDLDGSVSFDGASQGRCSGEDYFMIPADRCRGVSCLGSIAFVLCEGTSYSKCACAPPGAGWTLVDGGPPDTSDEARPDAEHDAGR